MSLQSQSKIRILIGLFLTTFFCSVQAAVTASTYVGRGTSSDPNDNITISINVPNDNSDSLFFHFSAPAGQEWAAFGLGGQMAGTLMFVTYASKDGKNVTVSPRIASGHVMPTHTNDVTVDVLSGSGIVDGTFLVNAKCNKCRSWNGGNIDVGSTSQAMIWAAGSLGTLDSDDVNAVITKHEGYNFFSLNLKAATGTGGVPLVNSTSDAVIGGDGPVSDEGRFSHATGFHAFLMVGAFLIVFPGGLLLLRVFEKVWLHWTVQSLALVMTILGVGVGIAISKRDKISPNLTAPHQIIGFVVVALAICAWTVGFVGHRIYKKTKKPAKIMLGHRVLGPLTLGLGLLNCISGFRFASNNRAMIIFIIAAVLMLIFVAAVLFFKRRQQKRKAPMNTPAAANFREGQAASGYTGEAPLPLYDQGGIPLQSYANNQAPPVYR